MLKLSLFHAKSVIARQLLVRQILIIILTLLVALTGFKAYQSSNLITKTAGKDTIHSIVAADDIRREMAFAHNHIVNAFLLTSQSEVKYSLQKYQEKIHSADDALLSAAQNMTYGDEERNPLLATTTNLSDYQKIVGMALEEQQNGQLSTNNLAAKNASNHRVLHLIIEADSLMREKIFPSAQALSDVNLTHLDTVLKNEKSSAIKWLWAFAASALLLVLLLLEVQIRLAKWFKRILNPFVVLSFCSTLILGSSFVYLTLNNLALITASKSDAFDSINALSKVKPIAFLANAHESLYLLTQEPDQKKQLTAQFMQEAAQIFPHNKIDATHFPSDLSQFAHQGLLGDEIASIAYEGEEEKTKSAILNWLLYVDIDKQIRQFEMNGKHDKAMALATGTQINQSDWALTQFMQSLNGTIDINRRHFDADVATAFSQASVLWKMLVVLVLCAIVGSVLGIEQRRREFFV